MRRQLTLATAVLLISILACTMPEGISGSDVGTALTMAAQTFTALALPTAANQTPTATLHATYTPIISVTGTVVPCNLAHFVTDVTVPDGSLFEFNTNFTKTWRLQNAGSCTWTSGYQLIYDSGDMMSGPTSQQLTNGAIPPGQTIDVSVLLKAPNIAGTFKGYWKLRDPNGAAFGLSTGSFWVQIKTVSAPQALPGWPLVQSGSSGPEVSALQYLLKQQGEELTVDGVFGPVTLTKLKHFQGQNGLAVDGKAGPSTWSKLIVQVQQGSHGPAVRAVQILLNEKFGSSLAVDGDFGAATTSAVKGFQGDRGLAADGIVGSKTWQGLVGW